MQRRRIRRSPSSTWIAEGIHPKLNRTIVSLTMTGTFAETVAEENGQSPFDWFHPLRIPAR